MEKMRVFLSWSGGRSRAVAEALKKYLPMIVNDLEPWLSSTDIDKGSRSTDEIAAALGTAGAGIICLTPSNLREPWILFEAGAIAKTVREKPLACTLLIGLEIPDLSAPLSQFQATKLTKADMLHLVKNLNKALGPAALDETQVADTFELCWPKLKESLDNLPEEGSDRAPVRRPEDMLKELVELTRQNGLSVMASHREIIERIEHLLTQGYIPNPALQWSLVTEFGRGTAKADSSLGSASESRLRHSTGVEKIGNALRDRLSSEKEKDGEE